MEPRGNASERGASFIAGFTTGDDVRLFEYQAKELLGSYNIPVPRSLRVDAPEGVPNAVAELGLPVVLKSQVLSGGRGKAGGVVSVKEEAAAEKEAARIFDLPIGGEKPQSILVEQAYTHASEMYLSITLDRGERAFVMIASSAGGVDVESMTGRVIRKVPLEGIDSRFVSEVTELLELKGQVAESFSPILLSLERLSREKECELAEINPLALGEGGSLVALDAKVILDDNALFRHPEFSRLHPVDEFEGEASRQGFAFVRLEGDIGVMGNGAGLVLSTLDLVADAGGNPACFLDLGGGAQQERVEGALRLVNRLPGVDRILVNIYGGITSARDVAAGIKNVLSEAPVKPLFARLSGIEEEGAHKLLEGTPVRIFTNAPDAVRAVVNAN